MAHPSSLQSMRSSCGKLAVREFSFPLTIPLQMGWLSGLCRLSSMQWSHQLTISQAPYSGGFRISSYLTEAHHKLQPAHSPPSYSYSENFVLDFSLVTPYIASHVASQQDKMKCNHDKFAKYREIAVGDCSRT